MILWLGFVALAMNQDCKFKKENYDLPRASPAETD